MFEQLPASRSSRWELMREFFTGWSTPLATADGFSEEELTRAEGLLGFSLPVALREWYALAGRRADVWSRQDEFLPPDKCRIAGDVLVFYIENQSVVRWGIPLSERFDNDPSVVVESVDRQNQWLIENSSTSEFALQMLLSAFKWRFGDRDRGEGFWANGAINEAALQIISDNYLRLAFPDWHWPGYPTRFFGTDDLVIETNGADDYSWLWVSSKSEQEFHRLEGLLSATKTSWTATSDHDAWPFS
jgi:hypothetical protein